MKLCKRTLAFTGTNTVLSRARCCSPLAPSTPTVEYAWRQQLGLQQSRTTSLRCSASSTTVESVPTTEAGADAQTPTDVAAATGTTTKPAVKKRVLSGVQPTGKLHLGNYLGAIRNWVGLQEQYDTYFCVVDLHAITVPHDPVELRDATRSVAATYMAAGIDPVKSRIFVQSHVTAHAELMWLLTCVTPIGWLNRMVQFKEKSKKQGENVSAGLLTYPILMAADILLYQADLVPVGEDQKQHLELARDLAERCNHLFGGKQWKKRGGRGGRIFKVPDVMIPPAGARVMSLLDGTAKMSKSAENDGSRINLLDSPDVIASKIKRCKTDAFETLEFNNPERPECANLLTLYQLASGLSQQKVVEQCYNMRWGAFKPLLTDALVAHLEPIQQRYHELVADASFIDGVLAEGAEKADETAQSALQQCRDAMGFVPPFKRQA